MVISALCSASEWKNVDNLGMTALEVAIREGNTADFDAFVTQGIDPNFHGKANFPVFSWAVMFPAFPGFHVHSAGFFMW